MAAIEFWKTYIDAQRQYAGTGHDGDGVLDFAQRLRSSEGRQDGLYWPPGPDGVKSPLGPFAAAAEQYLEGRKEGEPFRGYYFRILTEQGANPPGGAYNYVIIAAVVLNQMLRPFAAGGIGSSMALPMLPPASSSAPK